MEPATLAIRREDKPREMRAPLAPAHCAALAAQGFRVLVQPSPIRTFSDAAYRAAGAELTEDLRGADVVLGVKEVPPAQLLPAKTYAFFAHIIKAQPAGMPLLDAMLAKRVRLVDYVRAFAPPRLRPVRGPLPPPPPSPAHRHPSGGHHKRGRSRRAAARCLWLLRGRGGRH